MFEITMQGAIHIVKPNGPLNVEATENLAETFDRILSTGQPKTVLDMSGVPLLDSAGMESLLDVQEKFMRRGGELKLSGLNPLCTDIMHVTKVEQHFSIFGKVLDAVGSFAR